MAITATDIRERVIYKITSPTERVYIGITSNFNSRMESYRNCDKRLSRQTLVYNSIRKYGYLQHKIEIIDRFTSNLEYANGKEIFWIRTNMSNWNKYPHSKGLNLTEGGDGIRGYKASEESKEKNRQSKIGKKASAETKLKMSLSRKGKGWNHVFTDAEKENLRQKNSLYRHTEDAKARIGQASKGNKHRLGCKMTAEQIEHRSSLIRGRKITGEALELHVARIRKACSRPVLQYDIYGNFIKEYDMIVTARKETGISGAGIDRVLAGKYKQIKGFIFKYKTA